jgi:hypothetical protein
LRGSMKRSILIQGVLRGSMKGHFWSKEFWGVPWRFYSDPRSFEGWTSDLKCIYIHRIIKLHW